MYTVKSFSYFCNHKGYKHKRLETAKISFFHLTFVLEGSLTYIVNGEKVILNENDAMLLTPETVRERFPSETALIGFGTHGGKVAAATDWGGDMEVKPIRASLEGSYERLCHDSQIPHFLLEFSRDPALRQRLVEPKLERFIGVIYRPETERLSHYAYASLPRQFDAFVWFDETAPVTPLGADHIGEGVPETFPFGL